MGEGAGGTVLVSRLVGEGLCWCPLLLCLWCPVQNKPCDEPPLEVVPSSTEMATNYSKKKFVFRVSTAQGSEYLLQVSGHSIQCSGIHWLGIVH